MAASMSYKRPPSLVQSSGPASIASSYVRLALRVYFTVVLAAVSVTGDACCNWKAKLRCRQGRPIPLHQMTGWLSVFSTISALWTLRQIPSGVLGMVMILSGVLWVASDLAVSGLVTTVEVVSRCPFNTTDRYMTLSQDQFAATVGVEIAGYNYDLLKQAKSTSIRNGGISGIFKKVNSDLMFRADPADIVGQWKCDQRSTTYDSVNTTYIAIIATLQSTGILFTASEASFNHFYPDGSYSHLLVLTASEVDRVTGPWTVKAAVDVSRDQYSDRIIQTYNCSMEAGPVQWVLARTMPQTALMAWSPVINENIFTRFDSSADIVADPGKVIASGLDDIITIAGTAWNNTWSHLYMDDPNQGCLDARASVPLVVIVLIAIVGLTFTLLGCYLLALLIQFWNSKASSHESRAIKPPICLLDWMQEAARTSGLRGEEGKLRLKEWSYLASHDHQRIQRLSEDARDDASSAEAVSLRMK